MFKKVSAKSLCRAGVIAALYVVMSLLLYPLTFGIQFRLSEALTVLPLFFAESIPALFIGCLIVNLFSAAGIYDILIGSAATLLAAICTYLAGRAINNKILKFLVGIIFPVVFNAFAVPLIFVLAGTNEYAYMLEVAIIGGEELGAVAVFGGILYFALAKIFTLKDKKSSQKPEKSEKQKGIE